MKTRVLSELEGVCLGLVHKHGPCTAYEIRKNLKAAPSSHWRASAGSVYPLLQRLELERFLATTVDEADGRGRKLLRITRKGRGPLKKWLKTAAEEAIIAAVTDPVRSRTFFLDVLNDVERDNLLEELVVEMRAYLDATKEHLSGISQADDAFGYLGALGAVRVAEARLGWLEEVQTLLCAPGYDASG